jgi:hypothetical protein
MGTSIITLDQCRYAGPGLLTFHSLSFCLRLHLQGSYPSQR